MARKILLPLGRAIIASGSLLLGPEELDLIAEPGPRPREIRQDVEPGRERFDALDRARYAWTRRHWILTAERQDRRARQFIHLALAHDHEAYAVDEAADALCYTRQHLRRLSLCWFGIPPGIVIDLARVVSVSEAIQQSLESIALISSAHGFPDASDLSRMFLRFVGVRPGRLRYQR